MRTVERHKNLDHVTIHEKSSCVFHREEMCGHPCKKEPLCSLKDCPLVDSKLAIVFSKDLIARAKEFRS